MPDMFEYLKWRGDIRFSQLGVNDADALIFSALAYVHFETVFPGWPSDRITLRTAAAMVAEHPQREQLCRVSEDLELLQAAAQTERFGNTQICFCRGVFVPEEETQFAAVTFLPDDGTAFLAFRGTDNTLVGWKEDFNMSFRESVPAQQLALDYLRHFAVASPLPMRLGGHSKGGNLAFYASAKAEAGVQDRIIAVINHDGPGFSNQMLADPGYQYILPKVKTFVPQSSVFGMLLEHEEPYTIIRSSSLGVLQHDPYTWEILGKDFVSGEELTADSRFLDKTIRTWLAGMTTQERNEFFDTLFALLMAENASRPRDVMRPQNVLTLLKTLHIDDERRTLLGSAFAELVESAKSIHKEMTKAGAEPAE